MPNPDDAAHLREQSATAPESEQVFTDLGTFPFNNPAKTQEQLLAEASERVRRIYAGERDPYTADMTSLISEQFGLTPVEYDEERITRWWVTNGESELAHLRARLAGVEANLDAAKSMNCILLGQREELTAERDAAIQRAEKAEQALDDNWVTHQQVIAANARAERAEQALGGVVIADHTNAADCTNTIVAQDAAGTVTYAAMQAQLAAALARADTLAAGVERIVKRWQSCPRPTCLTRQLGHDVLMAAAAELESALAQSDSRAEGETNTKGEQ